ncbi:MBL fold metallo-hydrolase [Paucibacter sp. APW11]|uniref:MBL fold metallo-hydrolase n=1 Tax=Roseateles aquae TaxID=3077235 RepID=A0ABU3PFS8_9BURK|nr:MBL fold metallo-hydrolase [Paucibacter sp. APW11]MDT9001457.1 MBL fold metallo-hydrolase [Paucibacter sp. APW11]
MLITQIRNATLMLEFHSEGQAIGLLVDPMLAPKAALPSLKYFGGQRRRNPLVELPIGSEALLARASHALITHCQRGHFDHLDRAGKRWLREHDVPLLCMPRDEAYLRERGLRTQPLSASGRQPFFNGFITPVPCVHGEGWVGRLMEHGHGFLVELPGEPSVYLAGDTVDCAALRHCLGTLRPDIAVLPAGGARFDLGGDILLGVDDVARLAGDYPELFIVANHLEALDHCPGTRAALRQHAVRQGWQQRLWLPEDGEARQFKAAVPALA